MMRDSNMMWSLRRWLGEQKRIHPSVARPLDPPSLGTVVTVDEYDRTTDQQVRSYDEL